MTQARRDPGYPGGFESQTTPIGLTCRAGHGLALVMASNEAGLGRFGNRTMLRRAGASTADGYYARSTGARYARLTVGLTGTTLSSYSPTDYATVTASWTDTAGHTVASSTTAVPFGFKGERRGPPGYFGTAYFSNMLVLEGFFDLAALAATLSAAVWRLELAVTVTGANVRLEFACLEECPRFVVDDSEAAGTIPTTIAPGLPIGDTTSLQRVAATIENAYAGCGRTYLALAFDQTTLANCPSTTSAAFAALANLQDSGGNPLQWYVRPRLIDPAATDGVPVVARFLYKMSVGAHAGQVEMITGGSASPYVLNLAASTTWADSGPLTGILKTNGTGGLDTISFKANVAAGATLYLASFLVYEAATW